MCKKTLKKRLNLSATVLLATLGVALYNNVNAKIYKCETQDGATSYNAKPCSKLDKETTFNAAKDPAGMNNTAAYIKQPAEGAQRGMSGADNRSVSTKKSHPGGRDVSEPEKMLRQQIHQKTAGPRVSDNRGARSHDVSGQGGSHNNTQRTETPKERAIRHSIEKEQAYLRQEYRAGQADPADQSIDYSD